MRIGSLDLAGNVFLAPMAGITDPPFRLTVQRFGVSALWTEMISAHGLAVCRRPFPTMDLRGHHTPTVFQIYGTDPFLMAEAARIVQAHGASAVDLNMGCPARRVVGKGAGAALMKNLPLAGRIVGEVRKGLSIALTVKIRSGWDEGTSNAAEMAGVVESEGADAVIVHARSRSSRHSGPARADVIAEVKQGVRIPVIGNGGVCSPQDAVNMTADTGCDGIMVGRGALGRPWLPAKILGRFSSESDGGHSSMKVGDVISEHYSHQLNWTEGIRAVRRMRGHLAWYSQGFPEGARFRQAVFRMEDPTRVLESVRDFFGEVVIS